MSDPERERLQAAWSALSANEQATGCAPSEEIWDAVVGRRSDAETRALLAHSVGCSQCAAIWRLAHALKTEGPAPAESWPLRFLEARRTRWVAAAASLAAAAAVVLAIFPTLHSAEPVSPRGTAPSGILAVDETAPLHRTGPVLRWSGAPEGSRYAVTVSTRDLTVLHRASALSTPELTLPPAALASIPSGGAVVWRVEATLPDGRRLTSRAFVTPVE